MADLTFRFGETGADKIAAGMSKVADAEVLAAKGARLAADAIEKQRKATDVAAGASLALARADKILADAEDELSGRAALADAALRGQGDAAQKAGKNAAEAAAGVGSLAGTGGIPGGGMGAVIAAGAILSPVLVTLGVGLGGLGLAAAGIAKPIADAAGKTGGLAANMKLLDPEQRAVAQSVLGLGKQYDAFQKALKPEVLGLFNTGIKIAGGLLRDIQPVAAATGKAFNGFLGQLDKTFSSGQFRQFFQFMATTAAPDMKLLGDNIIALIRILPALLEDLQPLATEFLTISDNALKLAGSVADLGKTTDKTSASVGTNVGWLGFLSKAVANVTSFMKPGGVAAGAFKSVMDGIPGSAGAAAAGVDKVTHATLSQAASSRQAAADLAKLTAQYNAALSPLLAYTNALITQAGDADKLSAALKKSHDSIGLNTDAQRASFSAAQTYIQDLLNTSSAAVKSHQGIDAQINSIRSALPQLQNVKGGTRAYWQEVSTLVGWLHKLQAIKLITEAIHVSGTGVWTVTPGKIGLPGGSAGGPFAAGGRITAGTTPTADDVLIRASRNETVVSAAHSAILAPVFSAVGVPGYASGGVVGSYGKLPGMGPWLGGELRATESAIGRAVAQALVAGIKAASAAAASGGAPGAQGGPTSASAAQAQAYARSRLGAYGWGSGQMGPLISLWVQESGWNRLARNPSSGAYGIPQALPASKMGAAANPPTSSAAAQINWGLGYIKGRYGSPSGAWAHEVANNWYDQGGQLMPGWTMAYNGTGRAETVTPAGGHDALIAELRALRAEVRQLTGVAAAIPARTGQHVAAGVNGAAGDAVFRGRYPGR